MDLLNFYLQSKNKRDLLKLLKRNKILYVKMEPFSAHVLKTSYFAEKYNVFGEVFINRLKIIQ